jgi:Carboxypeptidase regulatory-like domain
MHATALYAQIGRRAGTKRFQLGALLVVFSLGGLSDRLHAHQTPGSSATITGTIHDSSGISVPGLRVNLIALDNPVTRTVIADLDAAFLFTDLPPGTYRLTTQAAGLEPFTSEPLTLSAGEKRELPIVVLRLATKMTTINVVASPGQIAEAQVMQEEQQRIVGFLPNFYTSYIWNAAPLTPKLKFNLALRTITDPVTFVVAAGVAGTEQAHKTFPGYGQELEGYAKRYGGTYADTAAGRILGSAVFPTIFHQDPRYFYRGSGSARSRTKYAILQSVVCRGDNGRIEPNYSHLLGSFTAAGLSNLYRAPQDRRASLTIRNGFIITGGGAIVNLMREFLSRRLTPNVPAFANGKP